MSEAIQAPNKGYLFENFRLFHLRDRRAQKVEPHYHEFDKVVVFYSGNVDYIIEGINYSLQPGDILFVRHNAIHKPLIGEDADYERAVLWIRPGFLESHGVGNESLGRCFELSQERRACLYRPSAELRGRIRRLIGELETAMGEERFGSELLANTYFLQLMVEFNRCVMEEAPLLPQNVDPKIDEALRYINNNLSRELSVDALAARCYLSRYYFMRRFKESTGYTVHNYISQKRLSAAAEKLDCGSSVTEAALSVGFSEYSAFLRAFKKMYGTTPGEYMRRAENMSSSYSE